MLTNIKKRPIHFGVGALTIAIIITYLLGYFTPSSVPVRINQTIFQQAENSNGQNPIYVIRYFWGPSYYNSPEKAARSQYRFSEVHSNGQCFYQLFTSSSPTDIAEEKKNASYFVFNGELNLTMFENRCDYYRVYSETEANISFIEGSEGKFRKHNLKFNRTQNITQPFLSCSAVYDIKSEHGNDKIYLIEATMLPCEVTTIRVE